MLSGKHFQLCLKKLEYHESEFCGLLTICKLSHILFFILCVNIAIFFFAEISFPDIFLSLIYVNVVKNANTITLPYQGAISC